MNSFLQKLNDSVIIGDGAMGTYIYQKGVPLGRCYEELNLTNPHLIKLIHKEYIDAGAEIIETNTFQANSIRLARYELQDKARDINLAGAKLAKQAASAVAAGTDIFVAGSVGPISATKKDDEIDPHEKKKAFTEQINALVDGGVDILILETFTDLDEILQVLQIAKKTKLPVIAQMTFIQGFVTPLGISVEEAIGKLSKSGADVIGANCGVGPMQTVKLAEKIGQLTNAKLSFFSNAGLPEYIDGRYMYLSTPEYISNMAKQMVKAGANIVGGCCGTTPIDIKHIAQKLKGARPAPRSIIVKKHIRVEAPPPPAVSAPKETFFDKIGKKPIVVVEVDPPRGLEYEKMIEGSKRLARAGVDAITVGDNPLAVLRMGNITVSGLLEREKIQTITHMSCRDKNLIALQSTLMEASVAGITSILAITGDPAKIGDQPTATSVYDVNSIDLIRLISNMNQGKNYSENSIGRRTNFKIGCAFNPNVEKLDHQIGRLKKKIEAGAQYALSQPLYDMKKIAKVYKQLNSSCPNFPVFFGVLPLTSSRNAEFLANEVPGISVPKDVVERIKSTPEKKQREEGIKISYELIDAAYEFISSFYIILPFSRIDYGIELTKHIKSKHKATLTR